MSTWLEFIAICLRDSGVVGMGQTPNAQMAQDAKFRLNLMIDEWRADSLLIYQTRDLSAVCNGTRILTIGPGADFNVEVRPDALEYAFLRQLVPSQPTPIDYWLNVLQSPDDYARISLKGMTAAPADAVWLDEAFPVANIMIFPIPAASQWELHIGVPQLLQRVESLTDEVLLPPRYGRAIYANLCVDLGTAFRRDPKPMMIRRAGASLRAIRRKNVAIPLMVMPRGLAPPKHYNILSDR